MLSHAVNFYLFLNVVFLIEGDNSFFCELIIGSISVDFDSIVSVNFFPLNFRKARPVIIISHALNQSKRVI